MQVPLRCKATYSRCSSRNKSSIQQLQPSRDVKERKPLHFSKCCTKRSTQHTVWDMIRDSMQWRPLLPKEGGFIHMEISGHPPIPLAQNNCPFWQFPSYFSAVFWVLNFRGCFEALNDFFWRFESNCFDRHAFGWPKFVNLRYTFPTSYRTPKSEILCKNYDPKKMNVQLTTLRPQTLWRFIF